MQSEGLLPFIFLYIHMYLFIIHSRVCLGEGSGTPLQHSCLENPMDRGAWLAAVHGVAKSRARLRRLSSSSSKTKEHRGKKRHLSFSPLEDSRPQSPPREPQAPFSSSGTPDLSTCLGTDFLTALMNYQV